MTPPASSRTSPPSVEGAAREQWVRPCPANGSLGDALDGFAEAVQRVIAEEASVPWVFELCNQCGRCFRECPVYMGSQNVQDMPPIRAEQARAVLGRSWNLDGSPRRRNRQAPEQAPFYDWFDRFHRCLICRRCAVFCPFGLDPSQVALAVRRILAQVGLAADPIAQAASAAMETGNPLGRPVEAWRQAAAKLERDIHEATGVSVDVPVDEKGADILLVAPAADLFLHPAVLAGTACFFHVAGLSWTLSAYAGDPQDLGFFLQPPEPGPDPRRFLETGRDLGVRMIAWGENGLGWRQALDGYRRNSDIWRKSEWLRVKRPIHLFELAVDLLDRGAFDGRLRPETSHGRIVTYHDPCHWSRSAGLMDEPRRLLQASVPIFREMPEAAIREKSLCCGAGCHPAVDPTLPLVAGRARVEAFLASGAQVLAAGCSQCRLTLPSVLQATLGREVQVSGVMELFGQALHPYLAALTGRRPSPMGMER